MSKNFFKIRSGATLIPQSSDPSDPNTGDLYYNSVTNKLRYYNGSTWSDIATSTFSVTAGENLTAGQVAYVSAGSGLGDTGRTQGQAYKVDATNSSRIDWSGVVQSTVTTGQSVTLTVIGRVSGYSSLTPGLPYYADPSTPGGITSTAPSTGGQYLMQIGIADTSTSIILNGAGSATATFIDTAPAGSPVTTGTRASPSSITAAGGIAFTGTTIYNIWWIQGSGGAVTVTANPQIAAGNYVGQQLVLVGRSATNTVTVSNGNGLSMNGSAIIGLDDIITFLWDGTNWVEMSRSF